MWKTYKNYKFYTTPIDDSTAKPKWDADMEWWLNDRVSVRGNIYYRSVGVDCVREGNSVWCVGAVK